MKHIYFSLLLGVFVVLSCSRDDKNMFRSLDEAMDRRQIYDETFELHQDSLRQVYLASCSEKEKWESAAELQKRYFYHDLDSCHRYSLLMLSHSKGDKRKEIVSQSNYAYCLYRMDSVQLALKAFNTIPRDELPQEAKDIYYNAGYHILGSYESLGDQLSGIVQDWWEHDSTSFEPVYYRTQYLRASGLSEADAIEKLKHSSLASPNDTAKAYFYIAREYNSMGDNDNAIKYYTKSAIYDLKISVKAYTALYELSMLLFDEGYTKRANRYIKITLEDAYSSHYHLSYKKLVRSSLSIMDALSWQSKQKMMIMIISLIVVSILLVIAVVLLVWLRRYSIKQKEMHAQVSELSKIKDEFLVRYMEKSVEYLYKVDDYRSTLRHAVKHDGLDAIPAILRKPSSAAEEFGSLLMMFDTSFLDIFPDFIQNVNLHMQDEWQLEQPAPKRLSTELRILALIRMGITKRQKIAHLLNLSVTTVYSYHYNMHKHSLHPKEDFDDIIKRL